MRLRGLEILIKLLSKTHTKVLHETGLGEVFEDAVAPTLHFLPSLTPTEESLRLLKSAYAALLKLGEARFPAREDKQKKLSFLDRMMRQGVLEGFIHAGENFGIAEFLLGEMAILVQNMGIHSVKHLKVSM
jgi:Tti2 family